MTNPTADELIQRAAFAERSGRSDEAARLWDELARAHPSHPRVLFREGRRRLEQGDAGAAISVFSQAAAADGRDPEIPLFLAAAHNMRGDYPQALAAIDRALAADPYFFAALLSKGALYERMGNPRGAAKIYSDALKIAPAPERLPPPLRAQYDKAKSAIRDNAQALADFLRQRTDGARERFAGADLRRFDECLDILAGVKRPFVHEPILLHFPKLPAYTFYERDLFPWMPQLEAATDMIRDELAVVLREDRAKFTPYIQMPAEAPVNQWADLNHSPDWSTFFLWRDGVRFDENCARCPKTAALLDTLPLARQRGYGPTAMFSLLAPRTRIPPHTGSSNARLICHLPLVIPERCGFRVGNDTREWRIGEAWAFDDSIDHEAWNDSDQQRAILIIDVWNPLLSEAERGMVEEMMTALNQFYASDDQVRYTP